MNIVAVRLPAALLLAMAVLSALMTLAGCGSRPGPAPVTAPASGAETLAHTVREGETITRIADLYYGDPGRAVAVAADNGVTPQTRLAAGSVLLLRFAPREYDLARRRAAALEPYDRGVAALAGGDLGEAERQFRLALHAVPDLADARYNLALVLLKRGQAEAAAELLQSLVSERPADGDFGFALGNALFQQTQFLEAAAAFGQVLAGDSTHRRAAFGRARALQAAELSREAIAAWQLYLELDQTSSWASAARRHLSELQGE